MSDSARGSRTGHSRRGFLGVLGTGLAVTGELSGTATAQEQTVVSVGQNYFDPIGLFVDPGTTVRFTVEDGSHSVTAYEDRIPGAATPFDSGVISEGTFEYTFDTPGTYDYYCLPHESMGMVGRIVVGEPGGPAEETPIPNGPVPESERILERETITVDGFERSSEGGGDRMGSGGRMGGGGPMGPETMDGTTRGWMLLVPAAVLTGIIGTVSGFIYWASNRQNRCTDGRNNG